VRGTVTTAVRLTEYLHTLGNSPLPCKFITEVIDEVGPSDAIDKYGRFVGNVRIHDVDINLENLWRGWAVVALYNSMNRTEIEDSLDAWKVGRSATDGVVKYMMKTIDSFDPDLFY
jgi:hypothetical protein